MSTFSTSTMQRPQQESSQQQSRSYGHYIDSNPSSTHSSPRSFTSDLENFYTGQHHPHHHLHHSQTYPIPAGATVNPYIPAQQRRGGMGGGGGGMGHPHMSIQQPSRSSSYSSYHAPMLSVSTSTSSQEHDPNERTARPGNAHLHAQFHSSLPVISASSSSSNRSNLPTNLHSGPSQIQTDDDGAGAGGDPSSEDGKPSTDYTSSTPGLSAGLSRPLKPIEQERLAHLDRLKFFLATAPSGWDQSNNNGKAPQQASTSSGFPGHAGDFSSGPYGPGSAPLYGNAGAGVSGLSMPLEPSYQHNHSPPHPALNRFLLPNQELVTCVLWNGLYHITGTDIVRALVFRFEAFGRPVRNVKKFEEGVFSDLRNLKPGVDACLEEPKSPFLDLLFKYQCIRTQKKQKVFYWFSVPHDRLFLDALERDLKREKMGLEPTTQIIGEPALSFTYDPKRSLYEQFSKAQGAREGESELETAVRIAEDGNGGASGKAGETRSDTNDTDNPMDESESEMEDPATGGESESDVQPKQRKRLSGAGGILGPNGHSFNPMLSLFEGSPTYKQRRKKVPRAGSLLRKGSEDVPDDYERGRSVGLGMGVGVDRLSSLSRDSQRRPIPMPMHPSMRHEFGAGSADEKAHEAEELSAADMFLKQAKGQLVPGDGVVRKPKPNYIAGDVNVVYHQDGSIQQRQQQQQQHMRRVSADTRVRDFTTEYTSDQETRDGSMSAPFSTTTFDSSILQQPGQPGGMTSQPYETVSADGKIRAFVCPLYSCGRLFKRMEHLKRHLRTHTMERPFTCHLCKKRFSRSDNLNQHLKTHERTGHGPGPLSSAAGVGATAETTTNDWMADDGDVSAGEGSNHGGSPGHSIAESEDEGLIPGMFGFTQNGVVGLDMLGDSPSLGLGQMDLSGYGFDVPGFPNQLDENMCTVEVQGGLQDVQGDEEGEVMRMDGVDMYSGLEHQPQLTGSEFNFSSQPSSAATSGLLFSSASNSSDYPESAQWATRAPSPPPGSASLLRNNMRAMQSQHSQSSSSQSSNYGGDDYSLASISAPSHKQTFDHAALFPPGVLDSATSTGPAGGNIGPMRRHRSMTPSIVRSGEPIRRPVTANSADISGSPASVSSMHSNRGYHPYYSNNNSRANSTHNSPQVHSVPLGPEYHRSESRNSNYGGVSGLHEQMRQMMSMDGPGAGSGPGGPSNNSTMFSDSVFRTGSPASFHQTESPATFNMDLPMQYSGSPQPAFGQQQLQPQQQQQPQLHAATMPSGGQYPPGQQQHQQPFDGYYVQQHHATL